MKVAARTHVGRRLNNEDAYLADADLGVIAVADGLGGYEGGEVASRLAVEVLVGTLRAETAAPAGETLRRAVLAAHEEIRRHRSGSLVMMGSTLAVLWLREGRAVIANVGDSRVYRLRGGELRQLTRDHSLDVELEASGVALEPETRAQLRNVLTRALGMDEDLEPDLFDEEARPGDVYLVCSDGLFVPLDDEPIAAALAAPPDEACGRLVEEAYARGGTDNITAVVAALA